MLCNLDILARSDAGLHGCVGPLAAQTGKVLRSGDGRQGVGKLRCICRQDDGLPREHYLIGGELGGFLNAAVVG